jgi:GntR family transcriptional regulator/MocR family aminotransferase
MRTKQIPLVMPLGNRTTSNRELAAIIRAAILDNGLRAGAALPSSRDFAQHFGVSRNTILRALEQLVDEDLVEARRGAGIFVKRSKFEEQVRDRPAYPYVLTKWADGLLDLEGFEARGRGAIDLRPGIPDLASIPYDEWRSSAVRKLRTLKVKIGDYGSPEGDPDLRRSIAAYIARSRGVFASPDNIIVTAGAQQAFDLITRILIPEKTKVAVEEPGYLPVIQTLRAAGAEICPVVVDDNGLIVRDIPGGVKAIYVTPSHQYPLGVTMSQSRRRELVDWADAVNGFIIEDDYDSEYLYSQNASPALHSSVETDRVLYVGTFSKNLMPGIRLGYLVVPEVLRRVFSNARFLVDRHSDNMAQAVLAEFMGSGMFNRHVMKMRQIYATRYAVLQAARPEFEAVGARLLPSQFGLHACLRLPDGSDEDALIAAGARCSVGLHGLKGTFARAPAFPGLIIGYGNVPAEKLAESVRRIVPLIQF